MKILFEIALPTNNNSTNENLRYSTYLLNKNILENLRYY